MIDNNGKGIRRPVIHLDCNDLFRQLLHVHILQYGKPKVTIEGANISFDFNEDEDGLNRVTIND